MDSRARKLASIVASIIILAEAHAAPASAAAIHINTTLQPGVQHGFQLGPSSTGRAYVVEVSPLDPAANGAHVQASVQPEFDGSGWNDVARVQLQAALGPVTANLTIHTIESPPIGDFGVLMQPGVLHGFSMGPVSSNRGYVLEVSPSGPSTNGAHVTSFAQPEFNGVVWSDVARIQLLASAASVGANLRMYAIDSPAVADFDFVLQPGVLHGFHLGPASTQRGYVVEVTPLLTAANGSHVRASVQAEFNGATWNDVARVQLMATSAAVNANVRIYSIIGDITPPDLVVDLTPAQLWPPNHQMAAVHANVQASDGGDPAPVVRLVSVTSDEPDGAGDDDPYVDDVQGAAFGTADFDFQLRSERLGNGDGRSYEVCYSATDASGNQTVRCENVEVNHDQAGHAELRSGSSGSSLVLYGNNGAAALNGSVASLELGTDQFLRMRLDPNVVTYRDADGDGSGDAELAFSEVDAASWSQLDVSAEIYARWESAGIGYLALVKAGAPLGVENDLLPNDASVTVRPNPAIDEAVFHYSLPRDGHVRLSVYDVAGRRVVRLVDGHRSAGRYEARLPRRAGAPPQVYLYTLETRGATLTGRFVGLRR